jgi:hypothetical protein
MLAIDVVLGALIGPPNSAADMIIARAEAGEWQPVVLDHARFARLLRYAQLAPSLGRAADGVLSPPSEAEIEHWRNVALGLQTDDDDDVS